MTEAATSVEALLQELANSLESLAACQQQELNAIVERQHSRVADLSTEKAKWLEQVNQLDHALKQHPDHHRLSDDETLAEQVAQLKQLLADVQQQSEISERVVQSTLNNIEQLKQSILSSARKDSLTYDAKGKFR